MNTIDPTAFPDPARPISRRGPFPWTTNGVLWRGADGVAVRVDSGTELYPFLPKAGFQRSRRVRDVVTGGREPAVDPFAVERLRELVRSARMTPDGTVLAGSHASDVTRNAIQAIPLGDGTCDVRDLCDVSGHVARSLAPHELLALLVHLEVKARLVTDAARWIDAHRDVLEVVDAGIAALLSNGRRPRLREVLAVLADALSGAGAAFGDDWFDWWPRRAAAVIYMLVELRLAMNRATVPPFRACRLKNAGSLCRPSEGVLPCDWPGEVPCPVESPRSVDYEYHGVGWLRRLERHGEHGFYAGGLWAPPAYVAGEVALRPEEVILCDRLFGLAEMLAPLWQDHRDFGLYHAATAPIAGLLHDGASDPRPALARFVARVRHVMGAPVPQQEQTPQALLAEAHGLVTQLCRPRA